MTAPAKDRVRAGALSILREGRLQILLAKSRPPTEDPFGEEVLYRVEARVAGHRRLYFIDFIRGAEWSCTCSRADDGCSHIAAVKLVTGPLPERTS